MNVKLQQQAIGQQIVRTEHHWDDFEQPKAEAKIQNELEINFQYEPEEEERRKEPTLEKCVRRYHAPKQIIGNKDSGVVKRKILRSDTCLLCEFKPKIDNYASDNEYWIQEMNEEIEQIENIKTRSLILRTNDKNVIGTK